VNAGADAFQSSSQSGIIAGSVVAGVLLILAVVIIVIYLRRRIQVSQEAPRGKSIALEFGSEYPVEPETLNTTAMTAETRNMLQSIKQRRDEVNAQSTRAVFENEALRSIVVNRDRGLYAEGINLKLFSQLADLSVADVSKVLSSLQMSDYSNDFLSLGINGRILVEIETIDDLTACGLKIPKPVARAFVKAMDEYRVKGVPKSMLK
jgi:hypothetical protein